VQERGQGYQGDVCRGGKWFCDDIETSSPCVEGIASYLGSEGKLIDEDNLLAEVYTEASRIRVSNERIG
jgi:hypothetical protein